MIRATANQKPTLPKQFPHEDDASTRKAIYGMHHCLEQTNRENKKKTKRTRELKIDCHVMHLKNSIKSKRESRKPKNVEKNDEKTA